MATVIMHEHNLARIEQRIDRLADATAEAVADDARDLAAVDTGEMKSTIHIRYLSGRVRHVHVGTDHWQFVEYGTSPHVITPKDKKALWGPTMPTSHPVARVNHPGAEAQPFMRPATYKKRAILVTPGGGVAVS